MIVIVGARDMWPTPQLVGRVLAIIVSTDEDIGIRGNLAGAATSPTEEVAIRIAMRLGHYVKMYNPERGDGNGRNWLRDSRIVNDASEVHAFFGPDGVEGGTEHIVTVALRQDKPVTAYAPDNTGELVVIGSDEGGYFLQSMAEYDGSTEWNR